MDSGFRRNDETTRIPAFAGMTNFAARMTAEIRPGDHCSADSAESFQRRIAALRAQLEAPVPAESDRTAIRNELVGLVREIDASIDSLETLRDSIKPLAERYKELYPRRAEGTVDRLDHLGASTFRERGERARRGRL